VTMPNRPPRRATVSNRIRAQRLLRLPSCHDVLRRLESRGYAGLLRQVAEGRAGAAVPKSGRRDFLAVEADGAGLRPTRLRSSRRFGLAGAVSGRQTHRFAARTESDTFFANTSAACTSCRLPLANEAGVCAIVRQLGHSAHTPVFFGNRWRCPWRCRCGSRRSPRRASLGSLTCVLSSGAWPITGHPHRGSDNSVRAGLHVHVRSHARSLVLLAARMRTHKRPTERRSGIGHIMNPPAIGMHSSYAWRTSALPNASTRCAGPDDASSGSAEGCRPGAGVGFGGRRPAG